MKIKMKIRNTFGDILEKTVTERDLIAAFFQNVGIENDPEKCELLDMDMCVSGKTGENIIVSAEEKPHMSVTLKGQTDGREYMLASAELNDDAAPDAFLSTLYSGVCEGKKDNRVALTKSYIHGFVRKTTMDDEPGSIPTKIVYLFEHAEGEPWFEYTSNPKAAKEYVEEIEPDFWDFQDSDDIKAVLKSIDRDAVRANCVTKDDIRKFLMEHGMEDCLGEVDGISEEDIENGFYIVHADASDAPYMALEIQRIDAIADLGIDGIPATDEEAGLRALQIGVPLINDVPGADKNRFVDTPENRKDVEDFYRRPFRVSFSLPGSIVINALSKEEAKKAVEAAINGNGSAIAEDISLVLQDHLLHRDVSVDDVEEEE